MNHTDKPRPMLHAALIIAGLMTSSAISYAVLMLLLGIWGH